MIDPFRIDGPTCISFSGGRTSAYMLHRLLEANGGLPDEARVLFCNTGKEEEATLRFVQRCSQEWGVTIYWLEYRFVQEWSDAVEQAASEWRWIAGASEPKKWELVGFAIASRKGEPFRAVIDQRSGTLPNPRSRYCSSELKTRTMHRYLRSLGWDEWETVVGIRADEPRRVAKFRLNPHPETKSEYVRIPLADAFVTATDVGDFWKRQPFDLELPNNNGKTMHGNCDLCFLKPAAQVQSLIAEKPERAVWWARQEADARASGDGRFFRNDRPAYAKMARFAAEQRVMFDPEEEAISCFCGD
jgi:3'-phosphoadenosine 5'-phosphosulfate sulfotransferase (PAPS reductase)/FAD synthetase